jgi:hypothetical protein
MDEASTTPIAEVGASGEHEERAHADRALASLSISTAREANRSSEAAAIQNETGGGSFRATARRERVSSGVFT